MNKPDEQKKFSSTENTGVLIQYKFNRALYYEKGITKDYFLWDKYSKSDLDKWIEKKKNHGMDT